MLGRIKLGDAPRDSNDARAFLQSRLSYYSRLVLLLDIVFSAVALLVATLNPAIAQQIFQGLPWQLISGLIALIAWFGTRGRPLSNGVLLGIDWVITLVWSGMFVGMSRSSEANLRPDLFIILSVTQILCLRAVYIPSSAARTAGISSAALFPALLFAYSVYSGNPQPNAPSALSFVSVDAMCATISVVVLTLTSKTIYGLRELVREAAQFGQYTLTEKIGEGGMGIVYKASHSLLRRETALKLLPPERAGEHNLARFEREVQQTSLLTHPNTVSIFDYGRTQDGVFYYAMEFLDGVDLDDLVTHTGPQPAARVIHILQQICGALHEAHLRGLTHRDIKPANIVLCERGAITDVAKVVDFGLVRVTDLHGSPEESRGDSVIGTPLYMSPEAISSPNTVGAASDLYAVGAVGYYLLTGTHVFRGATVVEVCAHHLQSKPEHPSTRLGSAVPEDLAQIILQCLEKNPAARPSSAGVLQEQLLACADAGGWTQEQARAWWQAHESLLAAARSRRSETLNGKSKKPRALTIELRKRALADTIPIE